MRKLWRHATVLAVTTAMTGTLLAGCGSGGAAPDGGRNTASTGRSPSASTSASASNASPSNTPTHRATPARPWNTRPSGLAALGDSITRGFDACEPLADCPEVSWATGTRAGVDSLSARLGISASHRWNVARSGAHVADLLAQAQSAAAHHPAMVTVLIGANDACAANGGGAMTSVSAFRYRFSSAMSYLHRALPGTQVLVASIPDLQRLWSVGKGSSLGLELWKLGLCPTMLRDAASTSPAATRRRAAVRTRVQEYNKVLGQVCAGYTRCRYDGGAVFAYPFTTADLSEWDFFHPSPEGQSALANVLAPLATRPATS